MNKKLYINAFASIKQNQLNINGVVQNIQPQENESLSKILYKKLAVAYPKFYKMDNMSKFGFLAAEFLLQKTTINENCSLIFANKSASLDTDLAYSQSIQKNNFAPSPSVFVYTLANIVMGEISIKHKLVGENIFLVSEGFDVRMFIQTIETQLLLRKADSFLLEWVEVLQETVNVFACHISQKQTENAVFLNQENLLNLYKK